MTALAKEVTLVVIHIQLSNLAPSTVMMGHLFFKIKFKKADFYYIDCILQPIRFEKARWRPLLGVCLLNMRCLGFLSRRRPSDV